MNKITLLLVSVAVGLIFLATVSAEERKGKKNGFHLTVNEFLLGRF